MASEQTFPPGLPSGYPTQELMSADFVESCGAILFDLTDPKDRKVCLIRTRDSDTWLIAKGRRNCGESRHQAALREVMEETGHRCHLLPVTMATRAPPPEAPGIFPDKARTYGNLTEPFACQIRQMKGRTKIIYWYIAALDQPNENAETLSGEAQFEPVFLPIAEAVHTPTYQGDRDLLGKAIALVISTLEGAKASTAFLKEVKAVAGRTPRKDSSASNVRSTQKASGMAGQKSKQKKKGKKARTPEQKLARMEKNKRLKVRKEARLAGVEKAS